VPAAPEVRRDALERVYRVARPRRGPAAVAREAPGREPFELARSSSWTALARAMLDDALAEPPRGKLARDLGRFIVPPPEGERTMSGRELGAWLATWRPPLDAIFPDRLRHRGAGGRR
jgi:hypothetical protein